MNQTRFLLAGLLTILLSFVCPAYSEDAPELKFAVTDIAGLEELQREFKEFETLLAKYSGVRLKLYPVTSRNVVIEAMKRGNIDLALAGPAEYVVIQKRVGGVPVVALERKDYFSAIITRSDSGLESIDQLKGKKIGFGDVGSTSYHLAPMQILQDAGVDPQKEIKALHINKHVAWKSLVRGDLSAIGFNYERFELFSSKDKSVSKGDFTVLAKGPNLPGDVLVASKNVSQEVVQSLRKAFTEHGSDLLTAILKGKRNKKYENMKFNPQVRDSDYDYVREMYATAGFPQYQAFIGDA